jgi:hypothetical protein
LISVFARTSLSNVHCAKLGVGRFARRREFLVLSLAAISLPGALMLHADTGKIRPLKFPDGLRSTDGQMFIMAEGGGSVDRVTVNGDDVEIETIKDGIAGPTSVALVGQTLWASEGQLPHLFEAAKSGPPHLPFRIVGVSMNTDVSLGRSWFPE